MTQQSVIDWLLQPNQPAIRYLTQTELLEKPRNDPEVEKTRRTLTKRGWAAEILSTQHPEGWWESKRNLYQPKFTSTNWMLLALANLGITREEPRIHRACELWIERFAKPDGGFGADRQQKSELCIVGNTARALIQFGYQDHPKVKSALEWLVREQKENGGWHCWGKKGVIDAWEGLSAFAVYPKNKWTRSVKMSVERGAEFYLERRLHQEGARYPPWYRFHDPVHYFYDILVGLDMLTALGYQNDERLGDALAPLNKKRRPDGRWNLDAEHPDVPGLTIAGWLKKYGNRRKPFALEKVGEPSKMITFKALRVMKRVEGSLTAN